MLELHYPMIQFLIIKFIQWLKATRAVIGRCLWSIRYRYMDDVAESLFQVLCFVQNGARFWKFLWDYFGLKQVKVSNKILAEAIYKEKNGKTETFRALYNLRKPKLQEIFTTVAIVCHRYERLAVLQNVFAIINILLRARKSVKKLF